MADPQLVNVVNAGNKLLEVFACLLLFQPLVLYDDVEKLATLDEFHYQVEIFFGFNDFVDLDNVWVVKLFQYFYLTRNSFYVFLVLDP